MELVGQVRFLLLELFDMLAAVVSCLVSEGPESLVEGVEIPLEARGMGCKDPDSSRFLVLARLEFLSLGCHGS